MIDAEASDAVITYTIVVCDRMVNVLFYPGSTYYHVSVCISSSFMICDMPDTPMHFFALVRKYVIVTYVYHACPILFMDFQTSADLVTLDMSDFDIILGMT